MASRVGLQEIALYFMKSVKVKLMDKAYVRIRIKCALPVRMREKKWL
jgi:hypothetical protein